MSPTSYQAAPPRIRSVAERRLGVKFCGEWCALLACCGSRWRCRGGSRRGRLFDEHGPAREGVVAGDIVDDIHLAGVEARLEGLQRQVKLELDGFALRDIYFG